MCSPLQPKGLQLSHTNFARERKESLRKHKLRHRFKPDSHQVQNTALTKGNNACSNMVDRATTEIMKYTVHVACGSNTSATLTQHYAMNINASMTHYMTLCTELALEKAMGLSQEYEIN